MGDGPLNKSHAARRSGQVSAGNNVRAPRLPFDSLRSLGARRKIMAESSRKKRTAAPKARKKTLTAAKKMVKKKAVLKKAVLPQQAAVSAFVPFELPQGYSDCHITLLVRDPYWIYSYWELPGWKLDELRSLMGRDEFSRAKNILRVYDVSRINFTGMNANKTFDIHISGGAKNWHVNIGEPNKSWCVDIGFLTADGKFYLAARSNIISTPRDSMSDEIDEEWMTIDWDKIYALSGGFGTGMSSGFTSSFMNEKRTR